MMNYLMKNRQPKKEAIKTNPEPKENIEKKTGKESLNKLKEQTIGRKRFLEDGEPQIV